MKNTPSASEQGRIVEDLARIPIAVECYLVSLPWWTKWKAHVAAMEAAVPFAEQIDNLGLV